MANQHPHPETLPRELPRRPEAAQSQRPPFLVHDIRFPIDDIRQSLPLLQPGNDRLDRIGRTEGIAGVDEPDIISRRLLKPLVHGIVYPLVRLAHPIGQSRFIPSDDICRPVCRTAVYHDIFDVRIGLAQHVQQRLLHQAHGIIGNRYD